MAETPGTIEQLALVLGRMLQPLGGRLQSGDVLGLLTDLGLSLPPTLLNDTGFSAAASTGAAAAGTLPDIISALATAIEADDGAAAVEAAVKLIEAGVKLVQSFSTIADKLQAANLPGVDPGVLAAFAAKLPERLLDYVVVSYLESFHPVIASSGEFLGIIDRAPQPGVPGDPTQPPHIARSLELSRFVDLVNSPADYAKTLYGWGDPAFAGAADLLLRLRGLLAAAGMSASFRPATATDPATLHFLLLTLGADNTLNPPGLKAALSIPIEDGVTLTVPLFKPGWSAVIKTQGTLEAGVAVTITPPATVAITPPTGSVSGSVSLGFLAQPVPPATAIVLLGQAGGSRAEATGIEVTFGVTFSWDSGSGTANGGFLAGGGIHGGKVVIDLSSGDGFLQAITSGVTLTSNFDLGFTWSSDDGLHVEGSGGLEIAFPVHISIGPIDLQQLVLSAGVASDGSIPTEISATISGNLGVLQASVERVGVRLILKFPPGGGNLGPVDLGFAFKPPNGVGIAVNAGIVTGGGYLYIDPDRGEYAGAIQLEIADFLTLSAIGLIDTKLPDGSPGFSLLIIISAEFGAGIQLGFGFTLNAVGGLLGVNRGMLFQPIMDGVRSGAINSVMFPHDIVANAPKIISDLRAFFPPQPGTFLVGPMAKLGWGEPTLVSLSLGIIIEIPPGDIAILGVLALILPDPDVPVLVLQVNFAGALEFSKQRMYFFASLYDSHILFITIEGEMGLLFAWGDNANFVVSVGGFHPQFNPPPLPFPSPKRISVVILNESYARIRADGYFAVTTNTVQFGAHAEMFFGFSALSVSGHAGFDALIQFSPFHFIATFDAGFSVQVFGIGVFSLDVSLTLEGPEPWHAHGTASLSFFFFSIDVGIDFTWGDAGDTTLPPVQVLPVLESEYGKQTNWRAQLPASSNLLVSLRKLDPAQAQFVLHPAGTLQVSQRAVPLDLVLDTVGSQKPADANRFTLAVTSPALVKTRTMTEQFAPAQYKATSDAAKLSEQAYAPMDSGIEMAAAGTDHASGTTIVRIVRYDVTIVDTKLRRSRSRFVKHPGTLFQAGLRGNAAARGTLSNARIKQEHPYTGSVTVSNETFAVALLSDNTVYHPDAAAFLSQAAAQDYLSQVVALDPTAAGTLHVLPQFEVTP